MEEYPWNILGIAESVDKREIQSAYARLIKRHRPREDPEKFREIRHAFEFALALLQVENATTQPVRFVRHESAPTKQSADVSTLSLAQHEIDLAEEPTVPSVVDISDLLQRIEQTMQTADKNSQDDLLEFIPSELEYDLDFYTQAAIVAVQAMAERARVKRFGKQSLIYIDKKLNLINQLDFLDEVLSSQTVNRALWQLPALKSARTDQRKSKRKYGQKTLATLDRRTIAFSLDAVLLFALIDLLPSISGVLVFAGARAWMEISELRASPGMWLTKLRVTNKRMMHATRSQMIVRQLVNAIPIALVCGMIIDANITDLIDGRVLGLAFLVWATIAVFSAIHLQDRLTGTRICRLPTS